MDTLTIITAAVIILSVIYFFIRIAVRIRKYGGSMTTTLFGSTYEFLSKDKKEAVEEIVEQKANKKMEEEPSGIPGDQSSKYFFAKL